MKNIPMPTDTPTTTLLTPRSLLYPPAVIGGRDDKKVLGRGVIYA